MPTSEKLCHCGRPLHYSNKQLQTMVEQLVLEKGENLPVTVGTRIWLIPRHYLALHGLRGSEVDKLGFQELKLSELQVESVERTTDGGARVRLIPKGTT